LASAKHGITAALQKVRQPPPTSPRRALSAPPAPPTEKEIDVTRIDGPRGRPINGGTANGANASASVDAGRAAAFAAQRSAATPSAAVALGSFLAGSTASPVTVAARTLTPILAGGSRAGGGSAFLLHEGGRAPANAPLNAGRP
jgi:hypothetical protein